MLQIQKISHLTPFGSDFSQLHDVSLCGTSYKLKIKTQKTDSVLDFRHIKLYNTTFKADSHIVNFMMQSTTSKRRMILVLKGALKF